MRELPHERRDAETGWNQFENPKGDPRGAREFLERVLRNVSIMDKGARESITNFEKGVGDVAVTYENEVLVGRQAGQKYDYIIPRSTILIENPVALVDAYVDKHGMLMATTFICRQFVVPPLGGSVWYRGMDW